MWLPIVVSFNILPSQLVRCRQLPRIVLRLSRTYSCLPKLVWISAPNPPTPLFQNYVLLREMAMANTQIHAHNFVPMAWPWLSPSARSQSWLRCLASQKANQSLDHGDSRLRLHSASIGLYVGLFSYTTRVMLSLFSSHLVGVHSTKLCAEYKRRAMTLLTVVRIMICICGMDFE